MLHTIKLLNFNITSYSKNEILNLTLKGNEKVNIISGNPQVLYNGLKNNILMQSYNNKSSIIIPDGIGVVLPLKFKGYSIEKLTGIDLFQNLLKEYSNLSESIYLLGNSKEILDNLINKLHKDFPYLRIVGSHHGFIDVHNCNKVLKNIKDTKSTALFVAMGSPLQDIFIAKYINKLPCKLFMGVGGSFDVLSGNIKRAPVFWQKLNLEWLYRILREPKRIYKLKDSIKFIFYVIIHDFLGKRHMFSTD